MAVMFVSNVVLNWTKPSDVVDVGPVVSTLKYPSLSKGVTQSSSKTAAPMSLLVALNGIETTTVSLEVASSVDSPVFSMNHSFSPAFVNDGVELASEDGPGAPVGDEVGVPVGEVVGAPVGITVGAPVGLLVGLTVGLTVGELVGLDVGEDVGTLVETNIKHNRVWDMIHHIREEKNI